VLANQQYKYLFVIWSPESVGQMQRGKVSLEANVVKWAFRGWHLDLFATSLADLAEETTTELIHQKTSLLSIDYDHTAAPRRKKVRKRSVFVNLKSNLPGLASPRLSVGDSKALRRLQKSQAKAEARSGAARAAAARPRSRSRVRSRTASIAAPTPALAELRRSTQLAVGLDVTKIAAEESLDGESQLYYQDSSGASQGPFPRSHLVYWVQNAFFDPDVTMASLDAVEWIVLSQLLESTAGGDGAEGEGGAGLSLLSFCFLSFLSSPTHTSYVRPVDVTIVVQ
jgi:hypothetical protein